MIKDELTYKIIGCAMKVHNTMGLGFQEVIYQRCLAIELENAGLGFQREQDQVVYYNDIEVGTRRADFVVEDKVVVEIKALVALEDVHIAQAKFANSEGKTNENYKARVKERFKQWITDMCRLPYDKDWLIINTKSVYVIHI